MLLFTFKAEFIKEINFRTCWYLFIFFIIGNSDENKNIFNNEIKKYLNNFQIRTKSKEEAEDFINGTVKFECQMINMNIFNTLLKVDNSNDYPLKQIIKKLNLMNEEEKISTINQFIEIIKILDNDNNKINEEMINNLKIKIENFLKFYKTYFSGNLNL